MNILFFGDISGPAGIRAIKSQIQELKKKYKIDYTIANAENTTSGRGLSNSDYNLLKKLGIDFFTMGNHTWKQSDFPIVLKYPNIVRPANIYDGQWDKIGMGERIIECKKKKIKIINLLGESIIIHKKPEGFVQSPFAYLQHNLKDDCDICIVDFHAEMTAEKNALLNAFAGKVTALVGTHTHVQTADNKIFNNTAYITDIGMCGNSRGIIGANPETIVEMYMGKRENFILDVKDDKYQVNAVVISIDDKTNKPKSILPINIIEK